ncbi:MAG: hypothetical protein AAFQ43_04985 [Bacteroidota bacterium]
MVLFNSLPDSARVWLFAASGPLPASVLDTVRAFLPTWASHGRPVTAEATVLSDRVLVVAALISPEDLNAGVSGCGIDAMSHEVESALSKVGLSQPSPLAVTYRDARGGWSTVSRPVFRRLAAEGAVDGTTHVMDLTPTDLDSLRASGVERPAAEAWHGRAFGLGVAA